MGGGIEVFTWVPKCFQVGILTRSSHQRFLKVKEEVSRVLVSVSLDLLNRGRRPCQLCVLRLRNVSKYDSYKIFCRVFLRGAEQDAAQQEAPTEGQRRGKSVLQNPTINDRRKYLC